MHPSARELLDRTRHAHEPVDGDLERVETKLTARLAAGGGAVPPSGARAAAGAGAPWWVSLALPSLILLGVAGFFVAGSTKSKASAPTPPPTTTASLAPEIAVDVAAVDVVQAPVPAARAVASVASVAPMPQAPSSARPAPPPAPAASGGLVAEMGLLGGAQTAIQRGDYVSALAKLDEHQRSFPSGLLAEERTAARVVALCGANRQAEARALAATFLKQHPTSPLAPRVKSACEPN